MNHLCENVNSMDKKVNSIEAGLEDSSAMKETLDKREVTVLGVVYRCSLLSKGGSKGPCFGGGPLYKINKNLGRITTY